MKAVFISQHGGPEVLHAGDLPDPVPGPGEVRVRVRACALNHLDIWVRQGARGGVRFPHVLGSDVAGVVESCGPGVDPAFVGKRVLLFPARSCGACEACRKGTEPLCPAYEILGRGIPGGYAELVCVPARGVSPIPDGWDFPAAAALPLAAVTAYEMLFSRAKLAPGETVLVTAAGSGVGTAAVQLAKAFGATVVASAGPDKLERLKSLGADHVVDRRSEDVAKRVLELTGGRGADLVCDSVGGEGFARLPDLLSPGGRIVFCGVTAGPTATLSLGGLFARRISLHGSYLGSHWQLAEILKLAARGKIRPVVDRVFPLAEAREAHRRLESGPFGKVVLAIGSEGTPGPAEAQRS